jgi:hypothetical protein
MMNMSVVRGILTISMLLLHGVSAFMHGNVRHSLAAEPVGSGSICPHNRGSFRASSLSPPLRMQPQLLLHPQLHSGRRSVGALMTDSSDGSPVVTKTGVLGYVLG